MSAHHETILTAMRSLGGRATAGDLVAKTALPLADIEQEILPALSHVGGHVAVDDHGNLLYTIDRLTPLPARPLWGRIWRGLYLAFQTLFFAALSVALVGYGLVYIALAIAGLAVASSGGDCACDCGGCGGCDSKKSPKAQAKLEQRASKRAERRAKREERRTRWRRALAEARGRALSDELESEVVVEKPRFFRAVHDFVFGPPRPPVDENATEKNLLGFIRDHQGRMTASDAALVTGLPLEQADRVLLALTVRVGGDVEATEQGAVVYTFDHFMVSAAPEPAVIEWIRSQGGTVTVGAFARQFQTDAADALARLQQLATMTGGRVVHGETTVFEIPRDAAATLARAASEHQALRDFTYVWERLEKAPAILGIPTDSGRWIWGFNILNLVMSTGLCLFYATGARIFDASWELIWLGLAPLAMSLSVFVIPAVRAIVEDVRNNGRRRRNSHRRALLGLVHRLEVAPTIAARELGEELGVGSYDKELVAHLEQLARELDGDYDPRSPQRFRFERVHNELAAVQRARDELDPKRFALEPIVFDTATSDR